MFNTIPRNTLSYICCSLDKSSVTEVKSYAKPPAAVSQVMSAVMTIMQKEPSWTQAKKELSDPNFLLRCKI